MESNKITWGIAGSVIIVVALGAFFFLEKFDLPQLSLEQNHPDSTANREGESLSDGTTTPQTVTVPFPYQGRDPEEVRPNLKEVELMRTEDREKLYQEIRDVGRAVKENPELGQSWLQLGILKKVIGDYEGARDAWEYIALVNPVHHVPSQNLGELYWRYLPDYPKAESKFRSAIRINAVNSSAYLSLSELYRTAYTQKRDQADDVLLEGLKVMPNDIYLTKGLALLYEYEQKYLLALEWWEKVQKLIPDDASAASKIAELKGKL